MAVDPSAEAISANALGCVGGDELADDGPTLCADTVVPVSTLATLTTAIFNASRARACEAGP